MKTINDITNQQATLNESVQNLKDYINEVASKSAESGNAVEIDEGLLGSLVGGIIGGTAGKSIMQAVCSALGVNEKSTLGQLLTSRIVLTAVGAKLGYSW